MKKLKPVPVLVLTSLLCNIAMCQSQHAEAMVETVRPNDSASLLQQIGRRSSVTALAVGTPASVGEAPILLSGRADGLVTGYDLKTNRQVIQHNLGEVVPIAFSPRVGSVACLPVEYDEQQGPIVMLWDVRSGKKKHTLRLQGFRETRPRVTAVAFSPDGAILATAVRSFPGFGLGSGDVVQLWDVKTGKPLRRLLPADNGTPAKGRMEALAFSPDGKRIATREITPSKSPRSTGGEAINLWEVATGKWQRTLKLRDYYTGAAIVWDKEKILETDGEALYAWNSETGAQTSSSGDKPSEKFHQPAFGIPEIPLLLVKGPDYYVVADGTTFKVFNSDLKKFSSTGSQIPITGVVAVNEGTIACGLADGTVKLWELPPRI